MPAMTQNEAEEFLNRKLIATLITLRPDGSPHAAPMWYMHKDGKFYSRTFGGSLKVQNIRLDPRVNLCICTHDEPYKYIVIDGTCEVVESEDKSKWPLMSVRYLGKERGEAYSRNNARRAESVLLVITLREDLGMTRTRRLLY